MNDCCQNFSLVRINTITALHSGITEEDLRAAGVANPSHRRRILENLPKNWNWRREMNNINGTKPHSLLNSNWKNC